MKINTFRLAFLLGLSVVLSACAGPFSGSFPSTEAQIAETDPQAPALDIQSWQTEQGAKVLLWPAMHCPCWISAWSVMRVLPVMVRTQGWPR